MSRKGQDSRSLLPAMDEDAATVNGATVGQYGSMSRARQMSRNSTRSSVKSNLSNLRGLGTAAEYQPLPSSDKPASLAIRESDTIETLAGVSPKVESRVAALRRRSSVARDKWATKMEFLLAVIGYAVDLGNIWRFPSICYKHGGGAFLIPYLIMLFVGGLPMFYMELALGQYHRSGCISIWRKICPMFKGIGYGICFICTFIACFYNGIIAQATYFAFSSIAWDVPWRHCNNTWNTRLCTDDITGNDSRSLSGIKLNTPSEEYYNFRVLELNKSGGFEDLGGVKFSMAVCLALVFVLVYFALWKGPKSSGKVVWVTATAPYLILTILLIRGLTLPGAANGIYYYLTPDFTKLWDPMVWSAAATQIFFSLGPGFGVLLALSSYNDFNNNCYRDALVTTAINCMTSFFSGFVIFSTLGYMSFLTNKKISEVVSDESSLIFIVYPQAIATMAFSPVWAFLFFVMLITLGIDSTFAGIEALITGLCDESKFLTRKREWFVGVVCVLYFIGSMPAISYGGSYVIPFLDEYGVSLSVLFIVTCEMIAVCWFYGVNKFCEDIKSMLGFYPGIYWRVTWTLCPIFISVIFVMTVWHASFQPMNILGHVYPEWSVTLGWFLRMLSVMSVPVFAIYMLCTSKGSFRERLRAAITPAQRRSSLVEALNADPTQIIDSSLLDPIHTLTQV